MNSRILVLAVTLLIVVSVSFSSVVFAIQNTWVEKSQMPTARFSFGVTVVDDKIYAIGGAVNTTSGEITGANEVFDPKTDTWEEKMEIPTPRYGNAVAAYANKIYVFGGEANGTYLDVNEVYDPLTDSWETRAAMPTARVLFQANVVDDKIYLIGGYGNQTVNEVYEPATDTWTTKSSVPTGVASYVSAVVDSKIIVIGGTTTNLTQIYDPKTDTWSFGASVPVNVSGAGVATVAYPDETTGVCVVGGETDVFSPLNVTQIYFPENNSWTTGASLPKVNSRLSAAYVDDSLYVLGGTRAVIHLGLDENLQCNMFNVIPEFPSWALLPLILSITLFSIIIKKSIVSGSWKRRLNQC
jgi:N-acetylneuraminic acid mutarotase